LPERFSDSVPPVANDICRSTVPAPKYLPERRSTASPHHYTPADIAIVSCFHLHRNPPEGVAGECMANAVRCESRVLCSWEGNRRSGITLIISDRLRTTYASSRKHIAYTFNQEYDTLAFFGVNINYSVSFTGFTIKTQMMKVTRERTEAKSPRLINYLSRLKQVPRPVLIRLQY